MVLDRSFVGWRSGPHKACAEEGRLRFFSKATGQTDPILSDREAAIAAGHPAIPLPPTFLLALNSERPNPTELYDQMGIERGSVLHGEQRFDYFSTAYAGDVLTFDTEVTDIYEKKGGALQFLIRSTTVHRGDDLIAKLTATTVVRSTPIA